MCARSWAFVEILVVYVIVLCSKWQLVTRCRGRTGNLINYVLYLLILLPKCLLRIYIAADIFNEKVLDSAKWYIPTMSNNHIMMNVNIVWPVSGTNDETHNHTFRKVHVHRFRWLILEYRCKKRRYTYIARKPRFKQYSLNNYSGAGLTLHASILFSSKHKHISYVMPLHGNLAGCLYLLSRRIWIPLFQMVYIIPATGITRAAEQSRYWTSLSWLTRLAIRIKIK